MILIGMYGCKVCDAFDPKEVFKKFLGFFKKET